MADQFWGALASLIVGLALGAVGRSLLRGRVRLSWSDAVVAGLIGAAGGSVIAVILGGADRAVSLVSVSVAVLVAVLAAPDGC